jgi:probable F420-dependent oxidoreductase
MKLGFFGINMGVLADPQASVRAARMAEAAGYESVWVSEHVVLPEPRTPESPLPSKSPMLDPLATLAHLAAVTTKVRLGTGIIILPQRNPVVLAKELTTVDVLSGGRLIFGVGAGYLKPEFDAIGVPFNERGARTDEYIEAIRALWTMPQPQFAGRFARFAGIDAQPRPVQQPHPPIVVGGWTEAAFRRAATKANGWFGFNMDVETAGRHLASLRTMLANVERPAALGRLEISITPTTRQPLDRASAEAYRDLGVDRLNVMIAAREADTVYREIEATAERLRPLLSAA